MAYVKCIRNLISSTVPDGKTVTPTDDISIWLACGGRSETYTTLSQVLADSTCLNALINDNNAIDYLVRSTTWASNVCGDSSAMSYIGLNNYASNTLLADSTWCSAICNSTYFESVLNVKVPVMTSNTTPSGSCNGTTKYDASYDFYMAFDGDDSTNGWAANASDSFGVAKVFYTFVNSIKIKKARLLWRSTADKNVTVRIIASNDNGSTWQVLSDSDITLIGGESDIAILNNNTNYSTVGILIVSSNTSISNGYGYKIQFYGRADI